MTRATIDGALDLEAQRQLHRPRTREELRAAIVEMASRGMGDYEIAAASGLSVETVRSWLGHQKA